MRKYRVLLLINPSHFVNANVTEVQYGKENKTFMNFDGLLYIIGTLPMFVATLIVILANFIIFLAEGMTGMQFAITILQYLVPAILLPILTAIITMAIDKRPIKPMIKGLVFYPIFLGTWMVINFKCLFKRNTKWEKINHVRSIKISDVKKDDETEKQKV